MKNILIISTGGTFNKYYNDSNGELDVINDLSSVGDISRHWRCEFMAKGIIDKDSLEITKNDRRLLLKIIKNSKKKKIIIIHGTDTMNKTAKYLAKQKLSKKIILTGAMVPYSIDTIEATANLASAVGYMQAIEDDGVYIAMNGIVGEHNKIIKNRTIGRFEYKNI